MKELLRDIEELEQTCQNFLEEKEEKEEKQDITLQLKSFNQIVTECKFELLKATPEHIAYVLSSLFKLDIETSDIHQIDLTLDKLVETILEKNQLSITEEKIQFLRDMQTNMQQVIEHIDFNYTHIITEAKLPLFFYKKKLQTLEQEKVKLLGLNKALNLKLEHLANILAKSLVDNFYSFYFFISFLLHVKKVATNEMLIIKIVNILDRYIEIITPAFNNRSLQQKDMIYHYTIFELQDLKTKALKLFE